MKLLVTGIGGQLGYDVVRQGVQQGLDVHGIGRRDLDITREQEVYQYISRVKPDVLIHCAAYTAVDQAESDKKACWNVNVEGTKHLVNAAKEFNIKFMYVSTDYVFDGLGEKPLVETDLPCPKSYYGLTKYEGEKAVQSMLDQYFIVRTSWVFGINGNNFTKKMLHLAKSREEVEIVGDQIGSPTYTYDLAKLLISMVQTDKYGIYHVTNEGFCSWAEFAEEIFKQANRNVQVRIVSTEEYPVNAVRPKNARLSKEKLKSNGFTSLPTWQDALGRYLSILNKKEK
ncbi:dTDP-4-dehydrorhamnose reductase [Peribacillus loiseleuriae]|uniref:dTDP-4-dehydrorhamnose reductase n=1 Tax=Peribacillus loiseleuriae TaxID=1679170 RepID=A0A0K9GUI0_9BACI|nr:dTDP-4-dehydrorhamnose reductase [Peribacillus loiseleuriae]KMY50344.1 dTDP-4-dehydrorhamnose reductase [Peribacillus loiseleuriae]